jgi:glycerophosphoryl diester phosphodiesterase
MILRQLFFDHIASNRELWQRAMWQYMCDTKLIKQHEYKLPLLMIQAFQADVLEDFTKMWHDLAKNDPRTGDDSVSLTAVMQDPQDSSSSLILPLPVPPTILLVSYDKCHQEEFWFEIEDTYREYVRGVGVDKRCFFTIEDGSLQYSPTIMEKARKAGWVVHPWTERPEVQFFVRTDLSERRVMQQEDDYANATDVTDTFPPTLPVPPTPDSSSPSLPSSPFTTVLEEIMFFKCKVGVHGIFSESVDTAVRAMNMPCPGNNYNGDGTGGTAPSECPISKSNNAFMNTSNVPLGPVILASFCFGILATLVTWKLTGGRRGRTVLSDSGDDEAGHQNGGSGIVMTNGRFGRKQHSAVSTEDDLDLTMTPEDLEML